MPFALVNTVHIDDVGQARKVPRGHRWGEASAAFRGIWTADRDTGRGIGLVVFEHRDQAESLMSMQQSEQMKLPSGVILESASVYEVQGEA